MSVDRKTKMYIASLLRLATEDLKGANALACIKNRNSIYLCEQAAEKIIRAILTSENKHAGNNHKLNEMIDTIPDENPIKSLLRSLEDLEAYATSFRYPTSVGRVLAPPNHELLEKYMHSTKKALLEVADRLGVNLDSTDPADRSDPIR